MKEASLTVGGFYKHLDWRDDLVTEALGGALQTRKRPVETAASGGASFTRESLIHDYLSEAHRNPPGAVIRWPLWQEISRAATNAFGLS